MSYTNSSPCILYRKMTPRLPQKEASLSATPRWVWAALGAWIAVIVTGSIKLAAHANAGIVPVSATSMEKLSKTGAARLEMFLHPHCPCSAASLRELQRILARAEATTRCNIYFYRPANQPDEWVQGAHWQTALQLPNVQTLIDPAGAVSAQRGIRASGEVQAFDATGACRFQGGVTPSRGHEGDSLGKSAVLAVLNNQPPQINSTPVFGCSLQSSGNAL